MHFKLGQVVRKEARSFSIQVLADIEFLSIETTDWKCRAEGVTPRTLKMQMTAQRILLVCIGNRFERTRMVRCVFPWETFSIFRILSIYMTDTD